MEKKFSKIQIAAIKRTAQNVASFVAKKEKINEKIAALEAEKAAVQPMIDAFQGPIKEMTGGYTTEDLVKREVLPTGKFDAKGKEIMQTKFTLIYPETVIPVAKVVEEVENNESPIAVDVPEDGSDFDKDTEDPWA